MIVLRKIKLEPGHIEVIKTDNRMSQVNEWLDDSKTFMVSSTAIIRESDKVVGTVKYIYDTITGQEIVTIISGTVNREAGKVTSVTYNKEDL